MTILKSNFLLKLVNNYIRYCIKKVTSIYKPIKTGFINHPWDFNSVLGIIMINLFIVLILDTNTNAHEIIIDIYSYLITVIDFAFEKIMVPIFSFVNSKLYLAFQIKRLLLVINIFCFTGLIIYFSHILNNMVDDYNRNFKGCLMIIVILVAFILLVPLLVILNFILGSKQYKIIILSRISVLILPLSLCYMFVMLEINIFLDFENLLFLNENENYLTSIVNTSVNFVDYLGTGSQVSMWGYDDDFSILMANTSGDCGDDFGTGGQGSSGGDNPNGGDNNQLSHSVGIKRKYEEDLEQPIPGREAPNPPVSPKNMYISNGGPDSLSDSESFSSGKTGELVNEERDWCPCCGLKECDCSTEGGCEQGDTSTANNCCSCWREARLEEGYSPGGHRMTDVTYCISCDCTKCVNCWQEEQNINVSYNSSNHSDTNNPSNSNTDNN